MLFAIIAAPTDIPPAFADSPTLPRRIVLRDAGPGGSTL
jgi:hypothetical protein